jgi:hypothetical protein
LSDETAELGEAIWRDRLAYSAIVDRPPLALPGGASMVVWTLVTPWSGFIETFDTMSWRRRGLNRR